MLSARIATAARRRTGITLENPVQLLFSARPWTAALFAVLSFPIGVFWFVALVTLISTGLGLAITFLGIPILIFAMWLWTKGAALERVRVNAFFGTDIHAPYRELPDASWLRRLRAFATDPAVWRDLAYLLLLFPIGIIEFALTMASIAMPLRLLSMPFWYSMASSTDRPWTATNLPAALGAALIGVLLLAVMPYLLVGMVTLHGALARGLLAPRRDAELAERVDALTESRSRAVEAALAERRRIERDLHDGAQQRLVALAMDLGMAKIKMDSDPEAARTLVDEAHKEAKLAMSEIRNLVQGIHPAVLTDRGLDAAISSLAGRCPVPVAVIVEIDRRPPAAVESAAYFVVAEALTNVAKHSAATEASVIARREVGRLVVEVTDNGFGGATAIPGNGLAGLADRIAALDGQLTVDSPPGGPTRIRAELPCA